MTKVIGVRFRRAGKIYFFAPGKYTDISEGDHVIVETARGGQRKRPGRIPTTIHMEMRSL